MAENALYAALVKAQAEFQTPKKDAVNPHFKSKYATLASLIEATRPALIKHGLAVTQVFDRDEAGVMLETKLVHVSGECENSTVPLYTGSKGAQAFGSEVTYMRRYSYAAILGVVADDDDDGNEAQKNHTEPKPRVADKVNTAPPPPPPPNKAEKQTPRQWADALIAKIKSAKDENELHDLAGSRVNQAGRDKLREVLPNADEEIAQAFTKRFNDMMIKEPAE